MMRRSVVARALGTIVVIASCGDGGTGPSGAAPDTSPPDVTMTAPSAGAEVAGTITASASASDNEGVVGVQFLLDGGEFGEEDLTPPYQVSWNTSDASDGARTLSAVARDAAGLTATAAAVSVTVVNTPSIPGSIEISVSASGDGSDADGFQIRVDGADRGTITGTGTLTVSDLTPGTHQVALAGLSPFCGTPEAVKAVDVASGGTAVVEFPVSCLAAPDGNILIHGWSGNTGELSLLAVGSGELDVLATYAPDADLSHDGGKLALIEGATLYVADADGSNRAAVAPLPQLAQRPRWSADGQTIAFMAIRPGFSWDVYLIDADGSNLRPLFATVANGQAPAWSPDGRLAYTVPVEGSEESSVWVANADGTDPVRLTSGERDAAPAWSPDGLHIAFRRQSVALSATEIYVMNADGTGVRNVTNHPSFDFEPVWSPDGEWLAFTSERNGKPRLWMVHRSGEPAIMLNEHYVFVNPLTWR